MYSAVLIASSWYNEKGRNSQVHVRSSNKWMEEPSVKRGSDRAGIDRIVLQGAGKAYKFSGMNIRNLQLL